MSEKTSNTQEFPWRDGFWYNESQKFFIFKVKGETVEMKNIICLDYPEIKPIFSGKWEFRNFGPAPEKVAEISGCDHFNIMADYGQVSIVS